MDLKLLGHLLHKNVSYVRCAGSVYMLTSITQCIIAYIEQKKRSSKPFDNHNGSLLRRAAHSPLQYGNKLYKKEESISHPLSNYHSRTPPVCLAADRKALAFLQAGTTTCPGTTTLQVHTASVCF